MILCVDWVLFKLASLVGSSRAQHICGWIRPKSVQPGPTIVRLRNADLNPTSQPRKKIEMIFET